MQNYPGNKRYPDFFMVKKGAVMNRTSCILFCIVTISSVLDAQILQYDLPYTADELFQDTNTQDARLIVNFLYWSYRRSAATLELQDALYKRLEQNLSELEGFNHIRHNPERPVSDISLCESHDTTPAQLDCVTYEQISKTYAQCCKMELADTSPLPAHVRDRITTLRSHVRGEISTILATKLMETYYALGTVYTTLQDLYSNYGYLLFKTKQDIDASRSSSIFSTLWSYMPSFLINITYQFENTHLELRQYLCDVLLQDIKTSDQLWREIEELRMTFYQTLYIQAYHYLSHIEADPQVFADQFSHEAHTSDTVIMLPDPYDLYA